MTMESEVSRLGALLHPKSVAVLGASQDTAKLVGKPIHFLQMHKYRGIIYPVNPKYKEVAGLTCYPSLSQVPGDIDAVVIGLPAEGVMDAVKDCARRKVKSVIVFASGYAEIGGNGVKMEEDLRDLARDANMILCGPNCQGVVNLHEGATLSFTPALERPHLQAGKIAFVTQSGAMGGSLFSNAQQLGIGFSYWISSGNEASLESADYMGYLVDDPNTAVIMNYSEGYRDEAKFIRAAEAARRAGKPIVALRVGRTRVGRKAAKAHTGAVSGPEAEVEALFQRLGILRVEDGDELLEIGNVLAQGRFPKGKNVGILSTSGGAGGLISDQCESAGLEVPEFQGETRETYRNLLPYFGSSMNPVDTTAMFSQYLVKDPDYFQKLLRPMVKEKDVHSIILMITMSTGERAKRLAKDIAEIYRQTDKPMVVSWIAGNLAEEGYQILRAEGIPLFMNTRKSAQAIRALIQYSELNRKS
ncbi:MAG TPA: CoA-binding protein [Thermodesulfobacteriota bacterium]|nr:CoA-binding protein [Thermodesulfobacteriota bacterium]